MDLIIETDIGHDPDDFFALCYLHSAGIKIRAILISIGHNYQTAIARFFCKEVGLNIPIGIAKKTNIIKTGGKGFHEAFLHSNGYPIEDEPDGMGEDILKDVLKKYPNSELFICGAPKNTGNYLMKNPDIEINKLTMQGGFLPYNLYTPTIQLEKFKNKTEVSTYNLNGAREESEFLINKAKIKERRFISKNICHTIIYDRERHEWIKNASIKTRSQELFIKGMNLYLKKHISKKFHDPTAAVCHLHPEIATWFSGKLYRNRGQWGTNPISNGDYIIADINYDKLWDCLKQCY